MRREMTIAAAIGMAAVLLSPVANAAAGRGFLPRQDAAHADRLRAGRRLRHLRPAGRGVPAAPPSRQSDRSCRRTCRAAAASWPPSSWTRSRPRTAPCSAARADAGARQHDQHDHQDRHRQIQLSRPRRHQHRHRRGAAQERHQVVRRRAGEAISSSAPPAAARPRCCFRPRSTPMRAPSSSWCVAIRARSTSCSRWSAARSTSSAPMGLPGIMVSQPGWITREKRRSSIRPRSSAIG